MQEYNIYVSPYPTLLAKAHSRLSLKFEVPLPPNDPLTLIVYSVSPDIIQIDESRTVI